MALPSDPTVSLDGHIDSVAFMGNVLWDILPNQSWTPYIGGGIGPARLSMNASVGPGSPFVGTLADTSDWQFAYQGIAGVKYSFSANWSVDLDYRYFATTDPHFKDVAGNSFKPQYHTHNVLMGITYRFPVPGS
jgi:opacity protein-like surface antigen